MAYSVDEEGRLRNVRQRKSNMLLVRLRDDTILDMPDPFDLYAHHITDAQVDRWLPRPTNAGR